MAIEPRLQLDLELQQNRRDREIWRLPISCEIWLVRDRNTHHGLGQKIWMLFKKAVQLPFPCFGIIQQLFEQPCFVVSKEKRAVKTESGTVISSLVFHREGKPVQELRKSWATA